MVTPARGAVVLVRFPFSDLSQAKLRPAIVLAEAGRGDWVLCQLTSNPYGDAGAIPLDDPDLASGSLRTASYARPSKLFTASATLMASELGRLKDDVLDIRNAVQVCESAVPVRSSWLQPAQAQTSRLKPATTNGIPKLHVRPA